MKTARTTLSAAVAIGLLVGSVAGAAAQDDIEVTSADDDTATPDCIVTEGTDGAAEECLEAEPVPLPVADYWVEWINHKEDSYRRVIRAIRDAKRSVSKTDRWYQTLVGVHSDELQWLANHEPLACFQGEYEEWRDAVEELHSIHTNALRFIRNKNVSGVRRTDRQRRKAMKRLNTASASDAACGPSEPDTTGSAAPGNPIVGTWRGVVKAVAQDGVNVTYQMKTEITSDGRVLFRVKRDDFCRQRGLGSALPLTHTGRGEFVTDGTPQFNSTEGRMHCYPRRGGRKLVAEGGFGHPWRYHETYDVLTGLQGVGSCSWRAKSGSPKDCRAFWRGTPAPASDIETSTEGSETAAEHGPSPDEDGE